MTAKLKIALAAALVAFAAPAMAYSTSDDDENLRNSGRQVPAVVTDNGRAAFAQTGPVFVNPVIGISPPAAVTQPIPAPADEEAWFDRESSGPGSF